MEPSIAFCGAPEASVDICIGAFPAATLSTETRVKQKKKIKKFIKKINMLKIAKIPKSSRWLKQSVLLVLNNRTNRISASKKILLDKRS